MFGLKRVLGPVLDEAKDRDIKRIADFATLRRAPLVRENLNWPAINTSIFTTALKAL